jgi:hypothetical protein
MLARCIRSLAAGASLLLAAYAISASPAMSSAEAVGVSADTVVAAAGMVSTAPNWQRLPAAQPSHELGLASRGRLESDSRGEVSFDWSRVGSLGLAALCLAAVIGSRRLRDSR